MESGFIYAIAAAVTWGIVYAIDQKILYSVSPAHLVLLNAIVAVIIILPFLFFSESPVKEILSSKQTIYLIIISAALATAANFFILTGIDTLDASRASVIEITYPIFVVIFAHMIFKTTPNLYFFLGGTLVFIGSYVIIRFS